MASTAPAATAANILVVEGRDEEAIIGHLRARHELLPPFDISKKGGIKPLLRSIAPEIKAPGRRAVGIVVDADEDLDARWMSVAQRLEQAGIAIGDPDPAGTIVPGTHTSPDVGIWVMPNNQSPGEIEDFIRTMMPAGDPVWPLAERYIDDIPPEHRAFKRKKVLRAKVHAWLATRQRPRPMGIAIATEDLDSTGEICTLFVAWLRRVFEGGLSDLEDGAG